MKKTITGLALAAALLIPALGAPASASAAPIKDCGRYAPGGGYGVYNITTRIVSCDTARGMARAYYHGKVKLPLGRYWWGPFRCRHRKIGSELSGQVRSSRVAAATGARLAHR